MCLDSIKVGNNWASGPTKILVGMGQDGRGLGWACLGKHMLLMRLYGHKRHNH